METLALIESLDRDGQVRQTTRVTAWPVRIGRGIDCEVVLDDPHVAAHHADLVAQADGVHVVPAPSANGVRIGPARIAAGSSARLDGAVRPFITLGVTTLRVRLAGEAIAPEQPLVDTQRADRRRLTSLAVLALLAAAWGVSQHWISSGPGESSSAMTLFYLGTPAGLGLWCGLWALGSKLFQRHFAFWPHLAVALFWPLLAVVSQALSGQLAFALSMPAIAKAGSVVALLAMAMLLWRHLAIVLPQRRRMFGWAIAGLVVVGGGLDLVERAHHQEPLVGDLYLGTISLPELRLVKPVSAQDFVAGAAPLEATLSRWAKVPGDDADATSGDDEDD